MAKTIFGTSEKTNFILNMKQNDLQRYCCNILVLAAGLLSLGMLIFELTLNVNSNLAATMLESGKSGVFASLVVALRSYSSFFLLGGVLAMIFAIIGVSKKQYDRKTYLLPLLLCGGMLLLGLASYLLCYSYDDGLLGQYGRNEGLLALMLYLCFFVVGSLLRTEKLLLRLVNALTCIGLFGCFWALLQILPISGFPSSYQRLETFLLDRVFLPSGLTGNPIAFAMLLTLLAGLSTPAALYADSRRLRCFHTVSAAVFLFFLLKTQCTASYIGCGVLLVGTVLLLLLRKKAIQPLPKLAVLAAAILLALLLSFLAPSINGTTHLTDDSPVENGLTLYDGAVVWGDGFYRLGTAGPYSLRASEGVFDVRSVPSLYEYLWGNAAKVVGKYPLLGTGPDNYSYSQLTTSVTVAYNQNLADRPYNDLLYIAATRGIPSLLCYLGLAVVALLRARRNAKQSGSWLFPALALALIGYLLTSLCGISVILVAPMFWMLLGAACGPFQPAEEPKPAGKSAKKNRK